MLTNTYLFDQPLRAFDETVTGDTQLVLLPYDASLGAPKAATVTITAEDASGQGHLRASQPSGLMPDSSVLNLTPDHAVANTTLVPCSPFDGGNPTIQVWIRGVSSVRLIVDVHALHYT